MPWTPWIITWTGTVVPKSMYLVSSRRLPEGPGIGANGQAGGELGCGSRIPSALQSARPPT